MKEFELKYGCNPNQKPAKIYMNDGSDLPIQILSGRLHSAVFRVLYHIPEGWGRVLFPVFCIRYPFPGNH